MHFIYFFLFFNFFDFSELRLSGSGSDLNFLKKLGKVHATSKRIRMKKGGKKDKNMKDSEFWVVHYAGNVKYDVEHFMNKNRDELFTNISKVISKSKGEYKSDAVSKCSL